MSLDYLSELLERSNLDENVRQGLSESIQYIQLLEQKIEKLETTNTKLNGLVTLRDREKTTLQNKLSFNSKSGLPNHHKVDADLNMIIQQANQSANPASVTVLIIKLDENYSIIHKTSKASISEWVIYQIGIRIKDEVPEDCLLYHTRDDEFILILKEIGNDESVKIARKISKLINEPHIFSGYHITIGCTIGIAAYPEHGISKELLLHNADIALDYAKQHKKTMQLFSEEMRMEVIEKMELQNSIIKALEQQAIKEINKQFELYYQPLVELDASGKKKRKIVRIDCEALIRWNHPEKGRISPDRFIPVAEETGLIMPIGNWVLYRAADQLREWKDTKMENTTVSVNLSPRQFKDPDIVDNIHRILRTKKIRPSNMKLELTESCLMDDPFEAIEKMKILNRIGVKFCIDDFGTGYSSLNYLRRLPISTLKIDRSFIENASKSHHDRAIIRAILSMSKEMSFSVIAEGIETQEQVNFLYNEGCRIFQGFLFAEPLSSGKFNDYISNNLQAETATNWR
ncbi:MAG: bifunctional diguanylate cyclase/phosphodiesterase [Spirochaetales bacterium]|nr:bifunctional diguanylate cyclase/phosphodiesterase [Spirochaetales bacterium]